MLCLFRDLNHPPNLLSEMDLGLGFTCFSIFCIGSTISSLGIRLPEAPVEARDVKAQTDEQRPLTGRFAISSAVFLSLSFALLVGVGIGMSCMELHLDTNVLYTAHPELALFSGFIDELGLPQLMHTKVSIWHCLERTGGRIPIGDVNHMLAFLMY